ncbi:MAG: hypothetical protein PWR30_103 [Candidatus Woesearchaeota archaeon]|nr:hypothetical protein [Candidatus Woesearchaeota archaeon]
MKKTILAIIIIAIALCISYYTFFQGSEESAKADYYIQAYEGEIIALDIEKRIDTSEDYEIIFSQPFNSDGIWVTSEGDAGHYKANVTIINPADNQSYVMTISIFVEEHPEPLSIEAPKSISVFEGSTLMFGVSLKDSNSSSNIEANYLPSNASFEDGIFFWTPPYDFVPSSILSEKRCNLFPSLCSKVHYVTFSLGNSSARTKIKVINSNLPPVFDEPLKEITAFEGEKITILPNATDSDSHIIEYKLLNEEGKTMPLSFKAKKEHDGQILSLIASDGASNAIQLIQLNVKDSYAPFSSLPDEIKIREGERKEFRLNLPVNEEYELSCDCPDYAELVGSFLIINPSYIVENESIIESADLMFKAENSYEATHSIRIKLENNNRPPEIIEASPKKLIEAYVDEPITFFINASDPDNDTISIEWHFSRFDKPVINNTITIAFTYPGEKKVYAEISDGKDKIKQEWIVDVRQVVGYLKDADEIPTEEEATNEDAFETIYIEI